MLKLKPLPLGPRGRKLGLLLLVLVTVGIGLAAFGGMQAAFGPFAVRLTFSWGWPGESRLVIPPLGEIKAYTHRWPVVLSATLERIDLPRLQHELLGVSMPGAYLEGLVAQLRGDLYRFLVRLCLVGGVAGLFAGLLFGQRRFRVWWRTTGAGVLLVLFIMGGVLAGFDQEAFKNPRYEGALEVAPWVLSLIEEGLNRLPEFSARLAEVAGRMDTVLAGVNTLSPLANADGEVKVLHVSDIHNNPAAVEFIEKVIAGFGVDLVIDTGDLTDYGTALETELNRRINNLGVKYLFVPGNHDSAAVVTRLRKYKNVIVLSKRIYETHGLTIMGWPDPASAGSDRLLPDEAELKTEAEKLRAYLAAAGRTIDILAVHNRKLVTPLPPGIPVVLYGHDHKMAITQKEGTVLINAGTTGAAGLRGFGNEKIPYSVALLRFNQKDGKHRLVAVDAIQVFSLHGKFTLERTVVNPPGMAEKEAGGER
ncbi:MAG: metallophosphoesterase [Firmicutes bacterium]|nr:metallophosphoesterase [Bacillota bacterium]